MEQGNKKVLVIEDDIGISGMLKSLFALGKIDAVFATNGKDGLALLKNDKPATILCDIMLPDIIGYDILKQVKQTPETADIPFVFLTAFADPADVERGLAAGADKYITKPFSAADLLKTVNGLINC